jgi:hypothetical protein
VLARAAAENRTYTGIGVGWVTVAVVTRGGAVNHGGGVGGGSGNYGGGDRGMAGDGGNCRWCKWRELQRWW